MNFNVKVYTLEGKIVKEFFNLNQKDAEDMYTYYTTKDGYLVKVDEEETFYRPLSPKRERR